MSPVTTLDLIRVAADRGRDRGRPPLLLCDRCGAENSATPGDYFLRPPAKPFRCCGRFMRLVTRHVVYADVPAPEVRS
jgi:hypothetical protein